MRLSHHIVRQRLCQQLVAAAFFTFAVCCAPAMLALGASWLAVGTLSVELTAMGVLVLLAPTERMDVRLFHLLPVMIAVSVSAGVVLVAPYGGPLAPIMIFNGPLVAVLAETPLRWAGHLALSTGLLVLAYFVGGSNESMILILAGVVICMWGVAVVIVGVWSQAERQKRRLEKLAQRDPLTGLANRRLLEERMAYECGQHALAGRQLSVVVLDLNGFKLVNDLLGHGAGDDLLRDVAEALTTAVRGQDTVARQGGDEFCVLAPETGELQARRLIATVRTALATVDAGGVPLTAGIGCATYPNDASEPASLLECADARQLVDKPAGSRGADDLFDPRSALAS